jgi:hypothetical protein
MVGDVATGGDWVNGDARLPAAPEHLSQVVAYSLGLRYMRDEQWERAASWLRRVPRDAYLRFSLGRREWDEKPSPDPLTAIRELRFLQELANRASTASVRAAALYRYAGYYYSHGCLLLYNPILWRRERELSFQFWWNERQAAAGDTQALDRYMHGHEAYGHALRIYLDIARRYSRAPEAPKALYRAACSAYHLENLNDWWRSHESRFGHVHQASLLMAELARRYPHHPLAPEAAKFAGVFAHTSLYD